MLFRSKELSDTTRPQAPGGKSKQAACLPRVPQDSDVTAALEATSIVQNLLAELESKAHDGPAHFEDLIGFALYFHAAQYPTLAHLPWLRQLASGKQNRQRRLQLLLYRVDLSLMRAVAESDELHLWDFAGGKADARSSFQ